ncbi:MAG: KH domain-containing protein [Candidatus Aenigmarchaeota archaeon]|nr:KH domain-containing protein [Candidatus Aenigmarchaeota archaeon]
MKARNVVIPGDMVEERKGRKLGNGVYEENDKVFSKFLGVPRATENDINVIPLSGTYLPRFGDRIIGVIETVEVSGWFVDINSPYSAFLPLSEAVEEFVDLQRAELTRYFDVGDIVFCRLSKVTKTKTVQASMRDFESRKLRNGVLIKVTPTKIPRIIGKEGSMIMMIKEKTGCEIVTGQNGLVWIRGENKEKAIESILTIEKESHTIGLTEKIEKMLGE